MAGELKDFVICVNGLEGRGFVASDGFDMQGGLFEGWRVLLLGRGSRRRRGGPADKSCSAKVLVVGFPGVAARSDFENRLVVVIGDDDTLSGSAVGVQLGALFGVEIAILCATTKKRCQQDCQDEEAKHHGTPGRGGGEEDRVLR